MRNTIYNAGLNLMRKKGEKIIPLFKEAENETDEDKNKLERAKEREALFNGIE